MTSGCFAHGLPQDPGQGLTRGAEDRGHLIKTLAGQRSQGKPRVDSKPSQLGLVGARTAGPAPSSGPRALHTCPSAEPAQGDVACSWSLHLWGPDIQARTQPEPHGEGVFIEWLKVFSKRQAWEEEAGKVHPAEGASLARRRPQGARLLPLKSTFPTLGASEEGVGAREIC